MAKLNRNFIPLSVSNPELLTEWDYDKNAPLTPDNVSYGSGKRVWWHCKYGHEWQTSINHRVSFNNTKGTGCPICSGKKVLRGFNDLQTIYPVLAKEWNYDRNIDAMPYNYASHSNKSVWWKCEYGHEWQSRISDRAKGNGCPLCSGRGTSLPEQGIAFYLESVCEVKQRVKIDKQEIDVYLPEFKIGVEYDGRYYHGPERRARETNKDQVMINKGVRLIRIKESNRNRVESNSVIYYETDYLGPNYEWSIKQLCNLIVLYTGDKRFSLIKICVQEDSLKIRERINVFLKANSLLALRPELAVEWNYDRNLTLKPEMFTLGANTKVWWKCSEGHEWISSISNRAKGNGCPYCSGRLVIRGETDLNTLYPDIAKEWHPTKNGTLTTSDISPNSNKKYWWRCKLGHEWQTSANSRVSCKTGCPICSGKRVLSGFNDLATVMPEIAKEWHPTKNGALKPSLVVRASQKRVWWLCSVCGCEYQSSIGNRTVLGRGCPKCGLKKQGVAYVKNRIVKEGSLLVNYPELSKEWHPTKNGILSPADVLAGSNKKVWWKCKKGHEWRAMVNNRSKGSGCPICSGRVVLPGFNDLATTNPELVVQWDYDKNYPLTPNQITSGSGKKVWWICERGHEWQTSVCHRVPKASAKGTGCPICNCKDGQITRTQTIIKNKGSLLDDYPDIAKEWHPTKNGTMMPKDYTSGSSVKVWWMCSKGHEWQAVISSRTRGNGCPYCSDKAHKRVLCIETNTIYGSLSEACLDVFGSTDNVTNISNVCKGKRKTAGGYHWKFVDVKWEPKDD